MRKSLRISIIVFASLLGLLILLWLGLALYIRLHKAAILAQLNVLATERLHGGQLEIRDMEPSLVRSFPDVSVSLKGVTLRDSLWSRHHHDLISVSRVFVKVNTFALLRNQLNIKQVTLENGLVYLWTDTSGYTNAGIFKGGKGGGKKSADITKLEMNHVQLVIDQQQKGKLFNLDVRALEGRLERNDSGFTARVHTALMVKAFAFNTDKGSFLRNQELETTLHLTFNNVRKTLSIPQQGMSINGQKISIGAAFSFVDKTFTIHITGDQLPLSTAASWLTPVLNAKLDSFHLSRPLDVDALLLGSLLPHSTPLIKVTWKTVDNTVQTRGLVLDSCSFGGSFSNEMLTGGPHIDENSVISIYSLKARVYGLPVRADTLHIENLTHPVLTGYFSSHFRLSDLDDSSGTFNFTGGEANANLYYKGGIKQGDTITPVLTGKVQLEKGAMDYLPRGLSFTNCNALLEFTGQDLFLHNITVESGKSALAMEGSIRNLTRLFFTAPEKLELNWSVRSPMLDLSAFQSFLGKRKQTGGKKQTNRVASQLDVMFNTCNVHMQVQLDKLVYGRFMARQVQAGISLSQDGIQLQQISLAHAGGQIQLSGNVRQDGANNWFKINTGIKNVHIDQLFYAFNDFGLQSLRSGNLQGILSAQANIGGNIRDNGQLQPRSLSGTVDMDLRNGALIHFTPLEDIGDIAFRRRNLGNITFDNLKNTFTLQGDKILIPPMQINSSALYLNVKGTYALTKGTDLYIEVPLRNPKKDEDVTDKDEKKKRSRKGIILHLHATDDGSGKVKIKLGSDKKE